MSMPATIKMHAAKVSLGLKIGTGFLCASLAGTDSHPELTYWWSEILHHNLQGVADLLSHTFAPQRV